MKPMKSIKDYIDQLEKVLGKDLSEEEFEQLQDDVYDMEREIDDFCPKNANEEMLMAKLERLILKVKDEFDLYDQEAYLNMMFPNRDDDDFDNDEIGDFINYD